MPDPTGTPVTTAGATESAIVFRKRQKMQQAKSEEQKKSSTIKINTGTTSEIVIPQHTPNKSKFGRSATYQPMPKASNQPSPHSLPYQQQLPSLHKTFKQVAGTQSGKPLDEQLSQKLGEQLNKGFEEETLPPFFDGTKYLSQDVDFQLFKGYNQLESPTEYEDFVEIFFTTVWNSLDDSEKQLIKGGLFNSGKGYLGEIFCTYRYVLKRPRKNEAQIANLVTKLLEGIELQINDEKVFVPALLAPNVDLYKIKIVRISQMPPQFVSTEFGNFVFEQTIKQLQGFENSNLQYL